MLARTTVLDIVREEGQRLQAATRRNGELRTWRAKHSLPAWKASRGSKKVA
jgi:hypothetical protein